MLPNSTVLLLIISQNTKIVRMVKNPGVFQRAEDYGVEPEPPSKMIKPLPC